MACSRLTLTTVLSDVFVTHTSFPSNASRLGELVCARVGIVGDVSFEPSHGEGTRAAGIFERIRGALPGGRGSLKEWVSCIWCFRYLPARSFASSCGQRDSA